MNNFPPLTDKIPPNPKIKICLSGLGIMVLNNKARAEIGYLPVHPTLISIWKNDCEVVMLNESMGNNPLEILSPDGEGNCECYFESGKDENYENMIDMSEIYGNDAELDMSKPYQSKIFIADSVFFTEPSSLINVVQFVESGTSKPEQNLHGVGTGLWAHSKNPNANFRFKGTEYRPGAGESYTIRILSDCRGSRESDFKFFFDHLTNAGESRFNLRALTANDLWFIDCEKRTLKEVLEQLSGFLPNLFDRKFDEKERSILINRLEWLVNMKCAPEPCLKVTFTNEPRSLP